MAVTSTRASVAARSAVRLRISGVVQGVGFRPFVYRLARQHGVAGWVLNGSDGVEVAAEASASTLERFVAAIRDGPPAAAEIATFEVTAHAVAGFADFVIRASEAHGAPTVRISPDLAVCDDCLRELFDPSDRRYGYPYINCTNCGPRYSIVFELPYDRAGTTMRNWPLCADCRREYEDPADRRYHAQPVACPACGPVYRLITPAGAVTETGAIDAAAKCLADGAIVAVKGIGGYHLACDARNASAVSALRTRKYRKERPFAVMAAALTTARELVELDPVAERLLTSIERPIVVARARSMLDGVAPGNHDLGVMLPYTPVHHLLFAAGAPDVLVMTSANRSSEPIAYEDEAAFAALGGIADAFLVGTRPIARRVDDAIVRVTASRSTVLRHGRGFAPRAIARVPAHGPILAAGGDLKNAVTLVVDGQAFASQHIGDLDHLPVADALANTVRDLCAMYGVESSTLTIAHDLHPGYRSSAFARELGNNVVGVQHHRAHIASVLAEHEAWDTPVLGFAFDGSGYGDDGTVWGGEVFAGSIAGGFERIVHLRAAPLPGGDAAARFPVQAAAGFLYELDSDGTLEHAPFAFPGRYAAARTLIARGVRVFETTSMGRLFDAVAALLGFTREQTFEGQAAMWLEHLARSSREAEAYPFPFVHGELDYRPLLRAVVADRSAGREAGEIARAFHRSVGAAVAAVAREIGTHRLVASGGVFQNGLLTDFLMAEFGERLWLNTKVPSNDGGLSLGQAALAAATARSV